MDSNHRAFYGPGLQPGAFGQLCQTSDVKELDDGAGFEPARRLTRTGFKAPRNRPLCQPPSKWPGMKDSNLRIGCPISVQSRVQLASLPIPSKAKAPRLSLVEGLVVAR